MQKFISLCFITSLLLMSSCKSIDRSARQSEAQGLKMQATPKNIILMIADGMGFEYVKAARIYNGQKPFSYERFPCKTRVTTCAYEGADSKGQCAKDSSHVTDSAASATAIAAGIKVSNGVISKTIPRGNESAKTILEMAKDMNKSTGIIATKLFTDATPAAFVAHADDRNLTEEILRSMFNGSQPNVVFGADTALHRSIAKNSSAGYQMVHSNDELSALANKIHVGPSCQGVHCPHIYGGFGQYEMIPGRFDNEAGLALEITPQSKFVELGMPHLSEMTSAALKILSKNKEGFFLMVESSNTDMIGHFNEQIDHHDQMPSAITVLVREMLEIEKTIQVLEEFVRGHKDTLLILTADHETGGLVVEQDKTDCLGREQCLPTVRWTAEKYEPKNKDSPARHTGVDVPLYAIGAGAERFCKESINNTDIPKIALGH